MVITTTKTTIRIFYVTCAVLLLVLMSSGCTGSFHFKFGDDDKQEDSECQELVHRYDQEFTSFYTSDGWNVNMKGNFFTARINEAELRQKKTLPDLEFVFDGTPIRVTGFDLTESKDGFGNDCYYLQSSSDTGYYMIASYKIISGIEGNREYATGRTGKDGILLYERGITPSQVQEDVFFEISGYK